MGPSEGSGRQPGPHHHREDDRVLGHGRPRLVNSVDRGKTHPGSDFVGGAGQGERLLWSG